MEYIPLHNDGVATPLRGRPSSIQSEGLPSLASNFSYQLPESRLRNDIETDTSPLPDPRTFDSVHLWKNQTNYMYITAIFFICILICYIFHLILGTNETPPSDKVLQDLCGYIAHGKLYAKLGRVLGVEDNEIQRIKEEQRDDLKETAFQVLKRWRELKGTGATKSVLRQALNERGLHNVQLKDDP